MCLLNRTMAGKSYTMREMKAIVDYLVERKAYGEIKGRKMWMEYANSQHTVRTWQSLKETFLKRILPSLHDPYYKLSMDQVRSFRQGYDILEKEKHNRLDLRTTSKDSRSNDDDQNDNQQATTSNYNELQITADREPPSTSIDNEVEKVTGEGVICEKISSRNRSSADTVVLEYENAEDIQRALESPKNINDKNVGESKSFKDLLTFEPMTPLVRELLEDFQTESESSDKEPPLHIDENPPENTVSDADRNINTKNHPTGNPAESVIEIHDSEGSPNVDINHKELEKSETNKNETSESTALKSLDADQEVNSLQEPPTSKTSNLAKAPSRDNSSDETNKREHSKKSFVKNDTSNPDIGDNTEYVTADSQDTANIENNVDIKNNTGNPEKSTQNTGNASSDTMLPNNQEALDNSKKTTDKTNDNKTSNNIVHDNKTNDNTADNTVAKKVETDKVRSEKRSNSQDTKNSKKQKLSDTDKMQPKEDDRATPIIEIPDTPIIENDSVSKIQYNTDIPQVVEVEITSTNIQKQINDHLKTSENKNKRARGTDILASNAVTDDIDIEVKDDTNPCLLSVSLFDEQFNNTKYSESEDDEATGVSKQNMYKEKTQSEKRLKETALKPKIDNKKETAVTAVKNSDNKIKVACSTESPPDKTKNSTKPVENVNVRKQREKDLANIFGFAHGGGTKTRKRQLSLRRRSHHQLQRKFSKNESNSSEWTSESDSESYVSPPRGRKNRYARKYMKPKSSRILQDPEEGMLYVVFGKNIYPLVKDGKHIKNFLTYKPDSNSDVEEESYWKRKYVEEKKKADEFKKVLKETRESDAPQTNESRSPASRRDNNHHNKPVHNGDDKELAEVQTVNNKAQSKNTKMVFKIAAKNGLECCLEGGWTQISNAMPQMVKLLSHETAPEENFNVPPKKTDDDKPANVLDHMEISSGISTPVIAASLGLDPEVHEKVNKIETEIFKEIEKLEKEETKQDEPENINVTKRKVRAKKESSLSITSTQTAAKRAKVSTSTSTDTKEATKPVKNTRKSKQIDVTKEQSKQNDNENAKPPVTNSNEEEKPTTRSRRNTKTKSVQPTTEQLTNGTVSTTTHVAEQQQNDSIDQKPQIRKRSLRISKQKETSDRDGSVASNDKSPTGSTKSVKTPKKYDTDSSASDIRLKPTKSSSKETTAFLGFDENARFMLPSTPKDDNKLQQRKNNRSLPKIHLTPVHEHIPGNTLDSTQGYQDSDCSPMKICLLKRKRRLSLSTQRLHKNRRILRRKSYPNLLQELAYESNNSSYFIPLRRSQSSLNSEVYRTDSFELLMSKPKPINKLAPIDEAESIIHQFDSDIRHFDLLSEDPKSSNDNLNVIVEGASSSNVSLPISPELSVVENMSISREFINSKNNPAPNEVQSNRNINAMDLTEYMISNWDASVPLMNQTCQIQNSRQQITMLNKAYSSRIDDLTLSDSLDQKLRDLLLESNKKMRKRSMEVDQTKVVTNNKLLDDVMEVDESRVKTSKKIRSKRSSTPRKKKTAQNAQSDPTIDEEYMDSCSYRGRQSCPPAITSLQTDDKDNQRAKITTKKDDQVKTRKKKDVIRVKILKPKKKTTSQENVREASIGNPSAVSTYILVDSGVHETDNISQFLQESNDSVDLIHNHSETCLVGNECLGDSVEFVDNSKSIISLDSTRQSVDSELQRLLEEADSLSGELNANKNLASASIFLNDTADSRGPTRVTQSASSILTDDLSDEPPAQPSKWYLFSEEDTTTQSNSGCYGANLNELFPITCAVPNLSTITESSRDNDDGNKQCVGAKFLKKTL